MRDGLEVVSLAPVLSDRTKADALLEAKFPRSIPGADRYALSVSGRSFASSV